MKQSTSAPHHTAIIMDGNGRWASLRGLPRYMGHRQGSQSVKRVVEAAPSLGIQVLTLYAFSSDNWNRPRAEVDALMQLLAAHLRSEATRCEAQGVRMQMIGRRDRLPHSVVKAALDAEALTATGSRLYLRLAVDYSAREAILRAVAAGTPPDKGNLTPAIGEDVDLLIRTGGEQRLSDFLLWESAYAELVFTPRLWPDFDASDLASAVAAYQHRERRYGGLGQLVAHHEAGSFHQFRGDRWLR